MFVSVDGKAKEVKEIFAGGADGLAHKINEIYGSVDGVAKLVYTSAWREPNAFDELTWAQIKELADNGLLLEYFKKGDLVDIKFKEPIIQKVFSRGPVIQDGITMQVCELTATGMRLVSYTAVPYVFTWYPSNETYRLSVEAAGSIGSSGGPGYWSAEEMWGMCEGLYNDCKEIDNRLPDDMREVLHDYSPCHIWEYYIDDEGKKRFRKEYDDCRVHQVSKCDYKVGYEFVEENNREEYILRFSNYPTSEQKYKKYFPEDIRTIDWFDHVSSGISWRYYQYANNAGGYWQYKLIWNDPIHSWEWDWENYDNWNNIDKMLTPEYTSTRTVDSALVPEVQIGVL
jgi:hypothetical protein